MVIGGMAAAFFLDKPHGAWTKIGIAIAGLVLGWLCYRGLELDETSQLGRLKSRSLGVAIRAVARLRRAKIDGIYRRLSPARLPLRHDLANAAMAASRVGAIKLAVKRGDGIAGCSLSP